MKRSFTEMEMRLLADFGERYWLTKQKARSVALKDADDEIRRITHTVAGKMGEEAVHSALQTSPPDYTIYPPGHHMVSGAADLMKGSMRIHVKTAIGLETDSWLANSNDPIVTTPTRDDVLALCRCDLIQSVVEFVGFISPVTLSQGSGTGYWGLPDSPRLRHTKRALYLEGKGWNGHWGLARPIRPLVQWVP